MLRKLSQTKKAVNERRIRSQNYKQKHFNQPLRKFLEHKYNNIYAEYVELYNVMVNKHPNRRNLIKTKTFREWMDANSAPEVPPSQPDIITIALRETFCEDINQNPEIPAVEIPDQNPEIPATEIPDQNPEIPVVERLAGNDENEQNEVENIEAVDMSKNE